MTPYYQLHPTLNAIVVNGKWDMPIDESYLLGEITFLKSSRHAYSEWLYRHHLLGLEGALRFLRAEVYHRQHHQPALPQ